MSHPQPSGYHHPISPHHPKFHPGYAPDIDTVGSSIRGKRAVAGQDGGAGISQKMAEVGWWGAVVKHK